MGRREGDDLGERQPGRGRRRREADCRNVCREPEDRRRSDRRSGQGRMGLHRFRHAGRDRSPQRAGGFGNHPGGICQPCARQHQADELRAECGLGGRSLRRRRARAAGRQAGAQATGQCRIYQRRPGIARPSRNQSTDRRQETWAAF